MTSAEYLQLRREHAHLRPDNIRASISFLSECALTALGIALSSSSSTSLWLAGQLVLGVSMWHWFVILHSCGHHAYFKGGWLNDVAGHWASLFCLIPYYPWRFVHAKHHRWVGWRDVDPTTLGTIPKALPASIRAVIDFCWKYWIPVFAVVFAVQTFWYLPRVNVLTPRRSQKLKSVMSVFIAGGALAVALYVLGPTLFRYWGLAFLVMLVITDPILLSQHVHLPLNMRDGRSIQSFKPFEQDVYSRTLVFPRWITGGILLHFNSHTVHHIFPHVPHYRLTRIGYRPLHCFDGIRWIRAAKRVPACRLLYESTVETGAPL